MSVLLIHRTSKQGFLMQGATFEHTIIDDDFIPGEELIEYTVRVFRCGNGCNPNGKMLKLFLDSTGKSVKITDRKVTVPLIDKIFPLIFQEPGGGAGTTLYIEGQPSLPPVSIPGSAIPMPCSVYNFIPQYGAELIDLTEGFKAIKVVGNVNEIFFDFTTPVHDGTFEDYYFYPDRFTPMGIFLAPGLWGLTFKMNSTIPGNLIFAQQNPPDIG